MPNEKKKSQVLLVDLNDHPAGTSDKLEAHRQGLLHRSVSVFLFNQKGEWLLQRRTAFKYHSGGLWSNTCCTHPYPDEAPEEAAGRRLSEEMGLRCPLKKLFSFSYRTPLDHGLIEHEYDHVFAGLTNDLPDVDPTEVWDWKYLSPAMIRFDIQTHPERYAFWFRAVWGRVLSVAD